MNGKSSPRTISKVFPSKLLADFAEIFLLAGIGAAGVLLHAYLRIPMKLPGHHGVIYMALLISGRLISNKKFASAYSSIGAATMLLIPLGFKDPFIPVLYLFPGIIIDIMFNNFKKVHNNIFFLAIICGIAYMTIPLTRIVIMNYTGIFYGSFINGYFYPVLTHFIFGFAGGIIPASINLFRKKKE